MSNQEKTKEQIYPSVYFAYDIALKSYDWAIQRADSMHGAIDRLLAWISSITIGVLALTAGKGMLLPMCSVWLYIGMGSFTIAVLIGIYAKVKGSLSLLSTEEVHKKCLHLGEWDFKNNIIFWASDAFQKNRNLINRKGRLYDTMTFFFLLEAIFFGKWLISLN